MQNGSRSGPNLPRDTSIRPVTAFDPPRDIRDEYLRQFFEQGTPIEEKHQEPLKPTTAEEHKAEAAYAEEIRQRLQ